MAVLSLRELCIEQVGLHLACRVECKILEHIYDRSITFQELLEHVRSLSWASHLPPELARAVLKIVEEHSNCSALVLTSTCNAHIIDSLTVTDNCKSLPGRMIVSCLGALPAGIHSLKIVDIESGDSILQAIAQSEAATTLRHLRLADAHLTDHSALLWRSFPELEVLTLQGPVRITWESFEEIAKINSLTEISIPASSQEILPFLLAPDALPNLHTLGFSVRCLSLLLDLLKARPNRERLLKIPLCVEGHFPVLSEIHELCPNLDTSKTMEDAVDAKFIRECHENFIENVHTLAITETNLEIEPVLTRILAEAHNLRELDIYFSSSDDTSRIATAGPMLGMLTNLTDLHLKSCLIPEPTWIPPHLTRLVILMNDLIQLEGQDQEQDQTSQVDRLVSRVCELHDLEVLNLNGRCRWTEAHIQSMLKSLPKLKYLIVIQSGLGNELWREKPAFPVVHGGLINLPMIITKEFYNALPLNMPSLMNCDLTAFPANPDKLLKLLTPARTRHLRSMWLDCFEVRPKDIQEVLSYFPQFSESLRVLTLGNVHEPQHLGPLASLRHLRQLSFTRVTVSDSICAQMLQNMKWLNTLHFTDVGGLTCLHWLRHPTLRVINIMALFQNATSILDIDLNEESCPALQNLTLGIERCRVPIHLRVAALPELGSMRCCFFKDMVVHLDISNCASLHSINIYDATLSALLIRGCNALQSCSFNSCVRKPFNSKSISLSLPTTCKIIFSPKEGKNTDIAE